MAVLTTACDLVSAPNHPYTGAYELDVSFQQFAFETGGCSMYCFHLLSSDRGSLDGAFEIDSRGNLSAVDLLGRFCIERSTTSGCVGVGEPIPVNYESRSFRVSPGQDRDSVLIGIATTDPYGPIVSMTGLAAGDTIVGNIRWSLRRWRYPDTHIGTFVARRR